MDKRQFLKQSFGIAAASLPWYSYLSDLTDDRNGNLTDNEDFWAKVRKDYVLKPDYINLENGYYCITPQPTIKAYHAHIDEINRQGSWYMRTVQWENKDRMARGLAAIAGCDPDELVITRNTTESLDSIISAYDWQKGDEAVMSEQDYGAMLNQFDLMARRYGIVNKKVSVPLHPISDDEIVNLYESAITPKTRLLMVCHMINITGHILPIKKICQMAHSHDVDVMVDGAHAFGHICFDMKDLECDYYGTSLHKWMSVPLGSGFLYIKKEKIGGLWPLFAEWGKDDNDIKKMNHTGTHPVHTDLAVQNAIDYYNLLGAKRKEARLRYLQNYWTSKVRDVEGITVNTPIESHRSCAIANVGVDKLKPKEMAEVLLNEYKIWTVAIDGAGVRGCRITPNVYTTIDELDQFVAALKDMSVKY